MKISHYLTIAAAVITIGLAGCGSSDDGAESKATTTTTKTTTTLSPEDQAIKAGEVETTVPDTSAPDDTAPGDTSTTVTETSLPTEPGGIAPADFILDYGSTPTLDALADSCFGGDAVACDELYRTSPLEDDAGSPTYEGYGGTCAAQVPFQRPSDCASRI